MSLKFITSLFLGKFQGGGGSGGGSTQVALLSVTTAPSGTFAVGSKYYNSTSKKIFTAIIANTWTGATESDPQMIPVYYLFDGATYYWDGDTIEKTDISGLEKTANKTDEFTETSPSKYPSSLALSSGLAKAGEPEIIMPFKQFNTILSERGAINVVSNDNFFIFSNGDVSIDGKTIIKTNAGIGADFSTTCNNNYYITLDGYGAYKRLKAYAVGADGTLTLVREFVFNPNYYEKVKIVNGILFFYEGVKSPYGDGKNLLYISLTDIEDTEIPMTLLEVDGYVRSVDYDTESGQYIISIPSGYYVSDTLETIFSTTKNVIPDPKGEGIYFGTIIDGKLVLGSEDEIPGKYYLHEITIGTNATNTITLPMPENYFAMCDLIKTQDKYVLIGKYTGSDVRYRFTANSLNEFSANSDGIGYGCAFIGKTSVITLNSKNILWSGAKEIVYEDFQKLNYSQIADKTIENTDVETSLINTNAGEYVGSNVIPANSLTAGDVITVRAKGVISTASSAPTTTLKAKLGTVVLIESSGALPTDWDGVYFELNAEITIRAIGATGKAIIGGNTLFKDSTTISAGIQRILKGAEVTINTTINNTLDITYTWSAASEDNTITVKQAHFEIKKQW